MTQKTPKRAPQNTLDQTLQAMQAASAPPIPPPSCVKLRKQDLPFWDMVIVSRARDEWSDADLIIAAQLARCMADIETEQALRDGETSVIENKRGTPIQNPRVSVLRELSGRQLALMRTLRMGGSISGSPASSEAVRRKAERDARKLAGKLQDEDNEEELLAS